MADMFGGIEGAWAAMNQAQRTQLGNLEMQREEVQLQSAQMTLAQQEAMIQKIAQMKPGTGSPTSAGGYADVLERFGVAALETGNLKQGGALLTDASRLRKNEVEIATKNIGNTVKQLNAYSAYLDGVHDQASWQQANMRFANDFGFLPKYAQAPYNPSLVENLKKGIATAKDKALTNAAIARQKASEADVKRKLVQNELTRAQTVLAKDRAAKLEKEGIPAPKAGQVNSIVDLMSDDWKIDLSDPDERAHARVLARPIAEEAQDILRRNPSMTQDQANKQAYARARLRDDFAGLDKVERRSGTRDNPGSLPMTKEGKLDTSQLTINHTYVLPNQREVIWTGTGFAPVGSDKAGSDDDRTDDDKDTDDSDERDNE